MSICEDCLDPLDRLTNWGPINKRKGVNLCVTCCSTRNKAKQNAKAKAKSTVTTARLPKPHPLDHLVSPKIAAMLAQPYEITTTQVRA